jgi:hypothetical protein
VPARSARLRPGRASFLRSLPRSSADSAVRSVDSWRSRASKVTASLACCPASMPFTSSEARSWSISPALSAVRSARSRKLAAAIRSSKRSRGVPGPEAAASANSTSANRASGNGSSGKEPSAQKSSAKGSSGKTSSESTKFRSSSYGDRSSATASRVNPASHGWASWNAATRRASPRGAAAANAEFPMASMNTVCQGALTIKGRSGTRTAECKSFFDPAEI